MGSKKAPYGEAPWASKEENYVVREAHVLTSSINTGVQEREVTGGGYRRDPVPTLRVADCHNPTMQGLLEQPGPDTF